MKNYLIPILIFVMLIGLPTSAFADITWDGVNQGYVMTDDEYTVTVDAYPGLAIQTYQLKTKSGSSVFRNGQNKEFNVLWIHVNRMLASDLAAFITMQDGTRYAMDLTETTNRVPPAWLIAHPSKQVTIQFNSDGRREYTAYLSGYGLADYDGPSPTPQPTAAPTTGPTATARPTVRPSSTPVPNPSATATANPTNPTSSPSPTDPGGNGGEECTEACQNIIDTLDCPEFDQYLGKWADMIRGTYPPPPDWENVAAIMRDKIVPAMGQEIVNRSPEIAKIIADEFQSREKPVDPPPTIPDFKPPVPRFTDTPKVTGNLTDNVPNFQPDYSDDAGFIIPDPASLQFNDNTDKGYEYQPISSETPTFSAPVEPSATDKGYKDADPVQINPPAYVGGRYTPEETAPPYKGDDGPDDTMPDYSGNEHTGDYRGYKTTPEEFQGYKGGE